MALLIFSSCGLGCRASGISTAVFSFTKASGARPYARPLHSGLHVCPSRGVHCYVNVLVDCLYCTRELCRRHGNDEYSANHQWKLTILDVDVLALRRNCHQCERLGWRSTCDHASLCRKRRKVPAMVREYTNRPLSKGPRPVRSVVCMLMLTLPHRARSVRACRSNLRHVVVLPPNYSSISRSVTWCRRDRRAGSPGPPVPWGILCAP